MGVRLRSRGNRSHRTRRLPDRCAPGASTPSGVLHAKLIASDRHTALLGSANLTDRALSDNIELGVVLRDPHLVEPLVDHFRWLLAPENKVMRPA
ncbi:phospholipase D-like domain-containing protein [Streptomyces sp. Li-HN-5-11]|uniref:phospholipase D-like domain-containing protein n=1 Tax=Streptomyces sp. Li-HN-5-11 TaxID=3075432 RepID=UPI0028AC21E1|nr:phospholipase D-like domain-containing protein [Streptomyces sp. Li-HN-5-11]WNM28982.1 phospholipase D-like domain-containing protein [Streptomyces sp. Li-HN-5-11]